MDRRHFLAGITCAAFAAPRRGFAQRSCVARLTVDSAHPGTAIAADFIGLSYETAVLAGDRYFTPANRSVLGLIAGLGAHGVIRVGGNTTERTVWEPFGRSAQPDSFIITPAGIDRFAATMRGLGWRVIYGVNLARGSAQEAAAEAAYVHRVLGDRLTALQIGNEPDGFGRWSAVRPGDYDFAKFLAEWQPFHAAIRAAVPDAKFAGPDVASETGWIGPFAKAVPDGLVLLTRHYYSDGPATGPHVTLAKLLKSAPQVPPILTELGAISRSCGLPFRIAETNSIFAGGRPGVSDTFGAALWGLELMFQIAAAGGVGINFHSGDDKVYTPIAPDESGGWSARPLYYAMLMFAKTGRGAIVPAAFERGVDGVVAYAAREGEALRVVVINKDPGASACVQIDPGRPLGHPWLLRLEAPALDAKTGITLGGAAVDGYGAWTPSGRERPALENSDVLVELPPASAAAVMFGES